MKNPDGSWVLAKSNSPTIIYSVRDGLGRELWWGASRKYARERARLLQWDADVPYKPILVYRATKPKVTT